MNILRKLTKLDLKLNRKRTIGTLVGIILATALITVVGGMFDVFRNTMVQTAINDNGYYHVEIHNASKEDLEEFKNNKAFSKVNSVNYIGSTYYEETDDVYHYTQTVVSMEKDTFDNLKYRLLEGTFPTNENEIIVSNGFRTINHLDIGDTVKVVSDPEFDGYEFKDLKVEEYKIVGITEIYSMAITTNRDSIYHKAYLTLKNPKNHIKDISDLLDVKNYKKEKSKKYVYDVNRNLLRWEVFSFSDDVSKLFTTIIGIVIGIILFTSVFSIRNSFAISTNEKIRLYGMLASIGATKKQIRKMVLFEGFCLGVIGIFGGIILGCGVVWLLTLIINTLALNANLVSDKMLYYKFTFTPMIIATIVSVVMIYLSTISSSIKAGRTSPIKNIRNSADIKAKKLKVPFFIRKIFKTGGILAYKNLKRSKKKYRVTIISLTISIFVFIVTTSLIEYGLMEVKNEFGGIEYDVRVNFNDDKDEYIDKFTSLGNAHILYDNYREGYYTLEKSNHIVSDDVRINMCDQYGNCNVDSNTVDTHEYFYDDISFREICKKIKGNYDYLKDKAIIVDKIKEEKKYVRLTDYKKGDTITLINLSTNDKYTYEVGTVTDYRPWGAEDNSLNIKIIYNKDYYKGKNKLVLDSIYYKTSNSNKLVDEINKLDIDNIYVENISELAKQINTIIIIFSIFIYGFIIVVTLIGVTSVFNTINSNMELRKSDFATLKSIGMTKREFNRMILLESIFYSFKSLFFGIIFGVIGSYFVYTVFTHVMDFGYLFPLKPIIMSVVFIVLLVYLIMKYSLNKTNKQNIIETIRQENI